MAKLFFKDKPLIGIDISSTALKVMALDSKKLLVLGYGSIDLDPIKLRESLEGQTPSSYLSENLKKLLSENLVGSLPSNHAVISIPAAKTYSRTFSLPKAAEKALDDAVLTEAEQYIPIPASTLYIDHQIIETSKDNLTILMSAVSQTIVDNIVSAAENADIRPVLIEPSISAVARILTSTEEGHLPTMIIDIGPATTDVAVLDESFVRITGGVAIGGNTLTLAIAKKMNISLETAHQYKVLNGLAAGVQQQKITQAVKPSLERIIGEVKKVMRYYNERIDIDNKRPLEQLLIVGAGSNVPGIGEYFTDQLIMPARVASPWQQLDFNNLPEPIKQFRPRYITAAGLASVSPSEARK